MSRTLLTMLVGAALGLAIAGPGAAQAPSDTLRGRVTDTTGTPLMGARVIVVGTSFAATTGAEGRYVIANVPAGTYRVEAHLIGYAPGLVSDVALKDGQHATVDFRLVSQAIELNPVVTIGYG